MSDAKRIAVIGAGTMGHGIAHVAAACGHQVVLNDLDAEALTAAQAKVAKNLQGGVDRGKMTAEQRDEALSRLSINADFDAAVKDADFVIEAVVENLDVKRQLFSRAEGLVAPDAILASNTSSLSITGIASELKNPERVVGMHFFNPVHIMKLVEVVVGEATSDAAREATLALAGDMGKEPIVVKDSPGFASSRLGVVIGLEAMRMVEQGVASAEDIDKAMVLGYKHPVGPLRLTDMVGLDVRLSIAEYLSKELGGSQYEAPEILKQMVSEGKLGKKTGQGFYSWDD